MGQTNSSTSRVSSLEIFGGGGASSRTGPRPHSRGPTQKSANLLAGATSWPTRPLSTCASHSSYQEPLTYRPGPPQGQARSVDSTGCTAVQSTRRYLNRKPAKRCVRSTNCPSVRPLSRWTSQMSRTFCARRTNTCASSLDRANPVLVTSRGVELEAPGNNMSKKWRGLDELIPRLRKYVVATLPPDGRVMSRDELKFKAAVVAQAAFGPSEAMEHVGSINMAVLALLTNAQPATWLCRPSASRVIHGTD